MLLLYKYNTHHIYEKLQETSFPHYPRGFPSKRSIPATFIICSRLPISLRGNFFPGCSPAEGAFFLHLKTRTNASHARYFLFFYFETHQSPGPSAFDGGEAAFSELSVVRYARRKEYKTCSRIGRCSANDRQMYWR